MISRYTYHGLTWVDLESPSREEILHISEEFGLSKLVEEEIFSTTLRSKVDLYDNFIYLILHFPIFNKKNKVRSDQELDFIIGKKFIVTVRYEMIDPIHQFATLFENVEQLDQHKKISDTGIMFMEMMKQLYKASAKELEDITNRIPEIERNIFDGKEEAMVKIISHTNRKLLDFKQAIRFHGDILQSYEAASKRFFGDDYGYYATLITSEFNKVNSVLEGHHDLLKELQLTNDSLLSAKSNEILRTFTILTFVMLPLTLITGIFSMNTGGNLIFIKSINDFYIIIAAMTLTGLCMFIFFRLRKWI
ncbi:MAG: Mg2 transporter protein CorA family protein magnesium transporter [Candidatus Nomurabacteria bacterium]|nr:Mg2 transporter protein CorA family protein magnesium transporter [Candidatus Nomurabacteria bacterium]